MMKCAQVKPVPFIEMLEHADKQDAHLYMLLDVETQKDFWQVWQYPLSKVTSCWSYYYARTPFAHLRKASPLLIELANGNVGNDIIQTLKGNAWGCVLASPFGLNAIMEHCQSWLSLYLPNGQEHLFRWYSPKILKLLLHSHQFDAEDKHRLYHPFYSIYCPEQAGTFSLQAEQIEVTPPYLPASGWFNIDPELLHEINHLYQGQTLTELAIEMFRTAPQKCMGLEHKNVILGLEEGLLKAAEYRNTSVNAKKLFAFSRFYFGSHFWQFPPFNMVVMTNSLGHALHELHLNLGWQQEIEKSCHDPQWLTKLAEQRL